ncbi:hypothetical protein Tco_0769726 [Tanacetum coccineum]|uniref:Uncharacterized protein n=1 Tax=Tanacetum coccineum TaxID=301880 RepID=A0ABQ4ZAI0_9ASTR
MCIQPSPPPQPPPPPPENETQWYAVASLLTILTTSQDHIDSDFLRDEMPSAPYQVVETTFDWISKNGEKWMIHDNKGTTDQQSDICIRLFPMLANMAGSENIEQAGQTGFQAKMQIAIYTISTWSRTVMEKIKQLIGRSAPPDFLAKLTYLIWIHHETLCCREDMLLNKAHKIGEMLQEKIEQLAEVERAFFHIDFESSVTSQT